MSTELVTTFMATLLVLGWLGLFAAGVSNEIRSSVVSGALALAAAVAVLATLSSLYLSDIADFTPCRYCWWQRIFMYPLAVILPVAALRHDRPVRIYALPLAAIGAAISVRHIWLQAFPDGADTCGISAPCTEKLVEAYGFVTIPQMTGLSFGLIIVLLLLAGRRAEPRSQQMETMP